MAEKIRKIISKRKLNKIVKRLANEILIANNGYSELNFVTVLDGALPFSNDLTKKVFQRGAGLANYSVKVKSYDGKKSSGNLCLEQDLDCDISGKRILLIEDIIEGGRTADFLKNYLLNEKKVKSVEIVSLLSKPSRRVVKVKIDYLGMEIPDEFVVGYGMDFNGDYRDLDYVGVLKN